MLGKNLKKDKRAIDSGFISSMIGAVLVIVVGILFLPLVQSQVDFLTVASEANNNTTSLSGVAATLFEQVPMFYVLGLIFVAIAWIIISTKQL
jgi:uncharacterized membrane protein